MNFLKLSLQVYFLGVKCYVIQLFKSSTKIGYNFLSASSTVSHFTGFPFPSSHRSTIFWHFGTMRASAVYHSLFTISCGRPKKIPNVLHCDPTFCMIVRDFFPQFSDSMSESSGLEFKDMDIVDLGGSGLESKDTDGVDFE